MGISGAGEACFFDVLFRLYTVLTAGALTRALYRFGGSGGSGVRRSRMFLAGVILMRLSAVLDITDCFCLSFSV